MCFKCLGEVSYHRRYKREEVDYLKVKLGDSLGFEM